MRKNSVSHGSTNEAVGSEIKFAGNDKEKMYEPKHRRKLVRVLTVVAYLFSVSLAAIMLSLFYVFIYNPAKPAGENEQEQAFSHLPPKTRYHRVSQGNPAATESLKAGKVRNNDLDLLNDTYELAEREEPRVLPVKGFEALWSKSEELSENDQTHYNCSDESENENKTILHKLLNLLK